MGVCESLYSPYQNEYVFAMMAACKRDAKPPCAKSSGFKRRTIEDVLREFVIDAREYHTVDSFNDLIAKYADELRGMMEVDND